MVRRRCSQLRSILRHSLIAMTLLAVASCSPSAAACGSEFHSERDSGEVRLLIDLAKADLQSRLGVEATEIIVQSAESLMFPYSHPALDGAGWDNRRRDSSGRVIKLVVGGSVYEYHGRVIGASYVLWREL